MNAILQITLAIVVVAALFVVAFMVYSAELIRDIKVQHSPKQRVDIFKGVMNMKDINNKEYSTSDKDDDNYKDLQLSINRLGGAEFAYTFWLYKPAGSTAASAGMSNPTDYLEATDVILLLRGAKRKTRFNDICNSSTNDNVLLKCPLIKLQRNTTIPNGDMDVLTVELNTQSSPDGVREMSPVRCNSNTLGSWSNMNGHKLSITGLNDLNYINKWFMITVVIRDTNPTDVLPVRNKIQVQIYINGKLELERYVDNKVGDTTHQASILRQNFGPLYVAPFAINSSSTVAAINSDSSKKFLMADLSYYNYGPGADEIAALYAAGPTKRLMSDATSTAASQTTIESTFDNRSITSNTGLNGF